MMTNTQAPARGSLAPFLLFLAIITLATNVSAVSITTEYPNIGYNDYVQASGKFNTELFNPLAGNANTDGYSRSINIPQGVPQVADLDNDGRNEIIVQNGAEINIYQNKTLDILPGITLNFTPTSNLYIYDIDGDGQKEIITGNIFNEIIAILQFNASGLVVKRALGVNNSNYTTITELAIACNAIESCVAITTGTFTSGATRGRAQSMFFNSTQNKGNVVIVDGSAVAGATGTQTLCLPQIRGIEVKDYDGDSTTEFIMTFIEASVSLTEKLRVVWFTSSGNVERAVTQTMPNIVSVATCSAGAGRFISPPLTFDATTQYSNMETIIARSFSTTEYGMSLYDFNGILKDSYPEATNVEGILISNVFRADALDNDGRKDFCVLGANPDGIGTTNPVRSEVNVLCASAVHTVFTISFLTAESAEFDTALDEIIPYNISNAYGSQHVISHASQQSNNPINEGQDNFDADEIVTSYGIYRLEYGGDNVLRRLFSQPYGDAAVIMVDAQKTQSFSDMILLTNNSLWYIDDKFENTGAKTVNVTYNPCVIDTIVQQNTTIQVTVKANDEQSIANEESDSVSSQVIGYFGDVNEQTAPWSANTTATPLVARQFSFTANSSIANGIIRIQSVDTGNPSDIDTVTQTFNVGPVGVVFGSGSCTTSFALETPGEDLEAGLVALQANNTITYNIGRAATFTGLSSTIMWLIFMGFLGAAVFIMGIKALHEYGVHSAFAIPLLAVIVIFIEVIMMIVGVMLGFIGIGVIIVFVICGIIALVIKFHRVILPGSPPSIGGSV